jgi:multiple sugar transport system substrate-binding protein
MNSKFTKVLAVAVTAVTLFSTLAGCGTSKTTAISKTASKTEKQVTISALLWDSDIPQQTQDLINAFMKKYPNIKVNMQNMTGSSTEENLQPKAAADALPDYFSTDGDSWSAGIADSGLLLDLSNTTAWKNTIDALKPEWTSDGGKHFGIPGGLCTTLIYYNKDMFDKAGITSFPDNWEDYMAACDKLKSKGFTPTIFYGGDANDICNANVSYGLAQYVVGSDANYRKDIKTKAFDFNTSAMAEVFDRIKLFPDKGYVQAGYMSTDYNTSTQLFVNGKAAMIFQGTWLAGTLTKTNFTVGCALPPYNEKGTDKIPVVSSETGWSVSAHSKNQDAALKLLEYWNGEGYHYYQNPRMCVPHLKDGTIQGEVKLASQVTDVMKQISTYKTTVSLYFAYLPATVNGSLQKIIQQVLLGQLTSAQAAKQVDTLSKS